MPNPKIDLIVQKSAFGGDGIAFHEGKICFVEGALPGEEVQAEVLQDKKDFLRLRTVQVLKRSAHRVPPPCEYYGRCGGCQYQHATYDEELRLKESQIREVLKKIAGIESPILPITRAADEYGYRNSVTFHIQPVVIPAKAGINRKLDSRLRGDDQKLELCFISNDNISKISVKSCHLLRQPLQAVFDRPVRAAKNSGKISFKMDEKGALFSDQEELYLRVRLSGQSLVVHSKGFFQNNLAVTELLCRKISGWVEEISPQVFYDLYAGVGTFSLVCTAGVPEVVCVEESAYAVSALRMNVEERKPKKIRVVPGKVEKIFPGLWKPQEGDRALIFLDPPRQGLEKKLAEFLSTQCRATALIYVSCDIATLARDLKILLAGGHWELQETAPFDMFPRTKHLEAAVLLTGKRGRIK